MKTKKELFEAIRDLINDNKEIFEIERGESGKQTIAMVAAIHDPDTTGREMASFILNVGPSDKAIQAVNYHSALSMTGSTGEGEELLETLKKAHPSGEGENYLKKN